MDHFPLKVGHTIGAVKEYTEIGIFCQWLLSIIFFFLILLYTLKGRLKELPYYFPGHWTLNHSLNHLSVPGEYTACAAQYVAH